MPDISTIDGVAHANITTVDGVAKANIGTIDGVTMPQAAAGATLWCVVGADGAVSTAAASDLDDWSSYVSAAMSTKDYNSVAYGKDGSGNGLWVAVNANGSKEIRYSSDPTNTTGWSNINPAATMVGVSWGNDVWVAVGASGNVYRSTTGTSGWSLLDLSGVTGWASDVTIYEVVNDGAGKWMFAQGMNVFLSTDDAATWTRVVDFSDNLTGYTAYTMAYTDSRWSVFMRKTGQSRIMHAAAADTSTWTAATAAGSAATGNALINSAARRMAAAAGTVIIAAANDISRSTDGGQDWTKENNVLPRTDVRDLATDGNGVWLAVFDSGRVAYNTNDGTGNWTEQTGGQLTFPDSGNNVENLDAVAADVFLPL